MKRAVLAIAAAFAIVAAPLSAAFAQEGPSSAPPPQQDLNIEIPQQSGKIDAKALAKMEAAAKAKVPAALAATKITCTPTDYRFIGAFQTTLNGKKTTYDAMELACSEGLGQVLLIYDKNAGAKGQDCILSWTGRSGPKDPYVCTLPANQHLENFAKPYLAKAGSPCVPTDIRVLGANPQGKIYEVACTSGVGEIISAPNNPEDKPQRITCFQATGNVACKLSTPEGLQAAVKTLATKADAGCTVDKSRYVMTIAEGDVNEVVCTNGKGFMIVSSGADYKRNVGCGQAQGYSGGCTLSDVKKAQTEEASLYTSESKKIGYDCDVEQYGVFPPPGGGREIVELKCKNRPDGAVVVFTGPGQGQVLNCSHAAAAGYRCNYTGLDGSFKELSKQLADTGKGACVVNASRGIGFSKDDRAFVEVACTDGDPGWVIVYPRFETKPQDIMSCGNAKVSGMPCTLPTNVKAAAG